MQIKGGILCVTAFYEVMVRLHVCHEKCRTRQKTKIDFKGKENI